MERTWDYSPAKSRRVASSLRPSSSTSGDDILSSGLLEVHGLSRDGEDQADAEGKESEESDRGTHCG